MDTPLTVEELIEKLKAFPPDMKVIFMNGIGSCYSPTPLLEVEGFYMEEELPWPKPAWEVHHPQYPPESVLTIEGD